MVYRLTESEVIARIEEKQHIKFVRWEGGIFNGAGKTDATAYCTKHDIEFTSKVEGMLVSKTVQCPGCRREKLSGINGKTDEEFSKVFMGTGGFDPQTTFKRIVTPIGTKPSDTWAVTCGKCQETHLASSSPLRKGVQPCRCNPLRHRKPYEVLPAIEKICKDRNYTFLGWTTDRQYASDKIRLRCGEFGHEWTTEGTALLVGRGGCKKCGYVSISDAKHQRTQKYIDSFKSTGEFPEGTTFRRLPEVGEGWAVTCPVCSENGYTQEFTTCHTSLQLGRKPCNCRGATGFDTSSPGSLYILRIYSDDYEFTGYGIARHVDRRLITHRSKLKKAGFFISEVQTFDFDKGYDTFELERRVKASFPLFAQTVEGFRTEATYAWLFDDVVAFAEQFAQDLGVIG